MSVLIHIMFQEGYDVFTVGHPTVAVELKVARPKARDSKMGLLAQTTTFTTFAARQRSRWKLAISLFTLSPTICYPSLYNLAFMKSPNCAL